MKNRINKKRLYRLLQTYRYAGTTDQKASRDEILAVFDRRHHIIKPVLDYLKDK